MELRVVSHESGEGSYPMPLDLGEKWSGLQSLLRICQQRELSLGLPKSDDYSHYAPWEQDSHSCHQTALT